MYYATALLRLARRAELIRMTINEYEFMRWWERTWTEKEELLCNTYGDGPVEQVVAFDWDESEVDLPGGCAMEFVPSPRNGSRHIAISYGLSQPSHPDDFEGDDAPSGDGYEIAIASVDEQEWKVDLIGELLVYVRQSSIYLERGQRLPVWFDEDDFVVLGKPQQDDEPVGPMRWVLVWPDFRNPRGFESSTGYFNVFFCTTITESECEFAKANSSAHLMLLLAESGVGQNSFIDRADAVVDPNNAERIKRISALSAEDAEWELFEKHKGA